MDHIHQIIRERHSTVTFSTKAVEEEKLTMLLEAARWAPSSYNEQPWRFVVGIKGVGDNYKQLFDCLVEANQYWAKYAPVLILSLAKKNSSLTLKSNKFSQYDTGMAVGNLLAQATSLGLFIHQMGGYNVNKAREVLGVNDEFELMSIMAVGYKGEMDLFPDDLKERESKKRFRKSIDEILI
ncbi:MAG: nitroreductase family protein [Bacteroidales bacterium]|nr:nitroreductase family protein [Bacteroidales bacterium]